MGSGWRSQFARPTGWKGRIVGHLLGLKNRKRSKWVLSLLDVQLGDRVVEIGFGTGTDIRRISEAAPRGFVSGIDWSPVMVAQAAGRNREAIREGRVRLELGDATGGLPFAEASFDKVLSINVAQFWKEPDRVFAEIRRVLRPGGVAAIAVQPRSKGATEETARATGNQLAAGLARCGFKGIRIESKQMKPVSTVCVLAKAG